MPYSPSRHNRGVSDITESQKRSQAKISKNQKRSKEGKIRSEFGERIVAAFGTDDYTVIRKHLGIETPSRFTTWMRAKNLKGNYPPLDILVKISQITNKNLYWLLTGEEEADIIGGANWRNIKRISEITDRSIPDTVSDLIIEALKEKMVRLAALYPSLTDNETKELRAYQEILEEWREVFQDKKEGGNNHGFSH